MTTINSVPFVDLSRIHAPLNKKLHEAFEKIITKGDFILGEEVSLFEKEYAKYTGATFGIAVASGSDGLLLAIKALGIGPGDEVLIPSHTFIATALAVTYAGATPKFVDIDETTFTMSVKDAEKKITKKTKAILPVCLYGQPADLASLSKLAKKHHIKLIIDACQSHGTLFNDKKQGTFGDAVVYSFYPGKNLGAFGDGGFVTSNSKKVADAVLLLRNIGRTGWYTHPVKGYNSRLDTLQAAILRIKLTYLDEWNRDRNRAAKQYQELLGDLPIVLPTVTANRTHGFHLYVIRYKKRDVLLDYLKSHGVAASIHYPIPIHKQKAYKKEAIGVKLPVSEKVAKEVISLPMFVGITIEEQKFVSTILHQFFKESSK
jgi:dTDP-4-amino-4,6-dideoxygalactose transaminase